MATTETRTGFRLPWSSDNRAPDSTNGADTAAALETTDAGAEAGLEAVVAAPETEPAENVTQAETRTDTHADASDAGATPVSAIPTPEAEIIDTPMFETSVATTVPHVPAASSKRPTKFLADLTNAMRAAAEAERAEILERFRAEAKAFVEQIHERSGGDATALRKQTDDDVAGIRDWSKAEIARIREETDERIAHRKSRLDRELEAHAARIARDVERVDSAVAGFEASMARFFEGLLNEDDPTSFAERAANLPEPPSLEDELYFADDAPSAAPTPTSATFVVSEPAPATIATSVVSEPPAPVVETPAPPSEPEPVAEAVESEPVTAEMPEANIASATDASPSDHPDAGAEGLDPRVAALGLSPDFAAAEAEALQNVDAGSADDDGSAEPVPALDDEAIAARLAGLPQPDADASAEPVSTQVVVTGLVSVASIAGFKRHLGRLSGVRSVGVSSGPEGEFLFTVTHGVEAALHDAIPTMPGFAARIVGDGEGILRVSARDPETDG